MKANGTAPAVAGRPMTPPHARMTAFQRRLTELGDNAAAKQLRQNPRTVRAWRHGVRIPRVATAMLIMRRWPDVTLADIYGNSPLKYR